MTHPLERQDIHEKRQQKNSSHDASSCVCCCTDCGDLFAETGNLTTREDTGK